MRAIALASKTFFHSSLMRCILRENFQEKLKQSVDCTPFFSMAAAKEKLRRLKEEDFPDIVTPVYVQAQQIGFVQHTVNSTRTFYTCSIHLSLPLESDLLQSSENSVRALIPFEIKSAMLTIEVTGHGPFSGHTYTHFVLELRDDKPLQFILVEQPAHLLLSLYHRLRHREII